MSDAESPSAQPDYDTSWFTQPTDQAGSLDRRMLAERTYAGLIGSFILVGFLCAAVGAWLGWAVNVFWLTVPAGLIGLWGGVEVAERSPRWKGSLIGHLGSNVALGFLLEPLLSLPDMGPLRTAALLVLGGTLVLTVAAWARPRIVKMFGSFAVGCGVAGAAAMVGAELWGPFALAPAPGPISFPLALLYLAYVDYYWTAALRLARTLDNAVDTAAGLETNLLHWWLARAEERAEERHPG